jgi:hypothetical protein
MRNLFVVLLLAAAGFAQNSDRHTSAQLTSTCANANSTCDTPGITIFGQQGDVLGPQTIEVNVQGYGLAAITASGAYTGSTLFFEYSDDGGSKWYPNTCTRVDTNIQEGSEAVADGSFTGWECSVGAATRMRVRQSAIGSGGPIIGITLTAGIVEPAPTVQLSKAGTVGSNPCFNPHANLQTAIVAMSSTALTQFIAQAAGQRIYPCFALIANATATTTLTIKYGTGSNCGTGTATWFDAFTIPPSTAGPVVLSGSLPPTPAGQAACYLLAGTTPTGTLSLGYVQQ